MTETYDLLAIGELLGDFIGTEISKNLGDATSFNRYQGGSPSNLAANLSKLGFNTAIVSCVGNENLGNFLIEEVRKTGVNTSHIVKHESLPSSIVLVARSTGSPDFIPYRLADSEILPSHISDDLLSRSKIVHTTCWPLSRNPSQNTLLDVARRAKKLGCKLSADLNYAERVWPDRAEAHVVIKKFLSFGAMIKLSDDDAERFYGEEVSMDKVFYDFHDWGASLICFTRGEKGSFVSYDNGKQKLEILSQKIDVKDTTGAGDAYWSGFLAAQLSGKSTEESAQAAAKMAAKKLQIVGPLPQGIQLSDILD
ncbi:fructokinase [Spirosomataceae bacterium TFI 002]|nr:fructokinase [Spirosomataceae bacterium TFI 002]